MQIERRFLGAELRAAQTSNNKYLEGYALKYGVYSQDLGGWKEKLMIGCFSPIPAIKMLHSHDTARVLGSTASGTLSVADSSTGLAFQCRLPQSAGDIFESVQRGDLTGMSFAMVVSRDAWNKEIDEETGERIDVRSVSKASLMEISSVAWPAYAQTDVGAATRALFPNGIPDMLPMEIRSKFSSRTSTVLSDEEWRWRARARLRAAMLD